jgi:hypothetical protein
MQQAHCQNPLMQETTHYKEKNCMKEAAWPPHSFLVLKIYGAFTLDVKSMFNENLGGILGGTQC